MKIDSNCNILRCNVISSSERKPNIKRNDNKYCCVPQCNSKGTDIPRPHFHRFPHEIEINPSLPLRRAKWCLALRIGKTISKGLVVCSKHFKISDYINPDISKKLRLKKTAIPSQNLPVSEETIEDVETNEKNSLISQTSKLQKRSKKTVKKLKRNPKSAFVLL